MKSISAIIFYFLGAVVLATAGVGPAYSDTDDDWKTTKAHNLKLTCKESQYSNSIGECNIVIIGTSWNEMKNNVDANAANHVFHVYTFQGLLDQLDNLRQLIGGLTTTYKPKTEIESELKNINTAIDSIVSSVDKLPLTMATDQVFVDVMYDGFKERLQKEFDMRKIE